MSKGHRAADLDRISRRLYTPIIGLYFKNRKKRISYSSG